MLAITTRGTARSMGALLLIASCGWAPQAQAAPAQAPQAQAGPAPAAPPAPTTLHGGRIGYVMTHLFWSIYQSPDAKADCPKGYNIGPRGQFSALFPPGKPHTLVDSQLAQEAQTWNPNSKPDSFPFYEPVGQTARGMNLDGRIGPNDFTSPSGEHGIDNQLFRALGCIEGFRGPQGVEFVFEDKAIADRRYNRLMIELSGVESLVNDSDVTVTLFRGMDRLLTDATGNKVIPGGSQHIDLRWGRTLIRRMKGKIINGVLTTEPIEELVIPWMNLDVPTTQVIKDMRLQLNLTGTSAEGMIGGYADVDTFYYQLCRNDSTHHLSNGDISAISLYKALLRLADAQPDPKTGAHTAISSALDAKFVQVYINPLTDAEQSQLTALALANTGKR
ncbi:MAG: hypothetical protein JSR66_02045 [Proteobacteria bacterium]|nr:hypothetical protein [Pseudomonadota bacterium]